VEDDADTREAVAVVLEHEGYHVVSASDGRDALATLRGGFRPCVIVLDLAMPTMDGFAFRRAQLADPELAAIPILVTSAGGFVNRTEARSLGMETFFAKPVDVDAFIAAVNRACGDRDDVDHPPAS
jgi:CheY-like chemotaxis protein